MTTLNDDSNQLDLNLPGLAPDTIFAGAGADFVRTSTLGGSLIFGQADNDTLISVGPNDTLYGGEDEDSIRSQRTPALLFGDAGNDTMVAEARASLYGGLGEDLIQGTVEANLVFGNEGADTLLGGAQRRDSLYGGKDNDSLGFFIAGGGNNLGLPLTGGFAGNEGSNYLRGDLGDDLVVGINVRDSLFGGKGNDTLRGVASSSYLSGDLEDDILVITNTTQTSAFGTSGTTVFTIGIERTTLIGGGGNDSLYGALGEFGSGRNFFEGGDGNDTIRVFATSDTAQGGAGDDFIVSATVTAFSSVGASSLFPGFAGRNLLDGGVGNDTIVAAFSTDSMIGGEGNDSLSGIFTQASGADGNDTLNASFAGTNVGLITLDGGLGNDQLIGNSSAGVTNFMNGGEGNDNILFTGTRDRLIGTLGGNDTITYATGVNFSGVSAPNVITDNLGSNFITGSNGIDSITTGAGEDILFGGPTNPVTPGADGDDTLNSGGGNDTVLGGFGNDYLITGDGNDSLAGGPGADTLIGGFGNDSFYYNNFGEGVTVGTTAAATLGTAPDQIGDFTVGQDKFIFEFKGFPGLNAVEGTNRLSSRSFLVLETGTYPSGFGPAGAAKSDPFLFYENKTGRLGFDSDGFGGSNPGVTLAILNNAPGITASDITLI
jgi:Ca2+-binding RTX toxin-like protein